MTTVRLPLEVTPGLLNGAHLHFTVKTTMTDTFSVDFVSDESEQTMDKTQSAEEGKTVKGINPLKISYEKPRLCSMHFKTVSHLTATCFLIPLTVETILIFSSGGDVPDQNRVVGGLNVIADLMCVCHVAMFFFWRTPNIRTCVMTFWCSFLSVLLLIISGFYIWTGHHVHFPQIIVPLHYFSFFGSIVTMIFAAVAAYVEHQASKYAITY